MANAFAFNAICVRSASIARVHLTSKVFTDEPALTFATFKVNAAANKNVTAFVRQKTAFLLWRANWVHHTQVD